MYQSLNKKSWGGRIDDIDGEDGYRWHQIIKNIDLSSQLLEKLTSNETAIVFLGFCSDVGVQRNQGRAGAINGPASLRHSLSNLAVHFDPSVKLFDLGDFFCVEQDLEGAQLFLGKTIKQCLDFRYFPVILGGGHEVAYGHFLGIAEHVRSRVKQPRIGIINFDAHFDLRSYEKHGTSGSPFLQISQFCRENQMVFSYLCLGIQQASNTRALFKTAERLNVNFVTTKELNYNNTNQTNKRIQDFIQQNDYIYLTVCLDVFAAASAPGVSSPALSGVSPDIVIHHLDTILSSNKVLACDIAELNPTYDIDNRTAKLAALLIYEIIMGKIKYSVLSAD